MREFHQRDVIFPSTFGSPQFFVLLIVFGLFASSTEGVPYKNRYRLNRHYAKSSSKFLSAYSDNKISKNQLYSVSSSGHPHNHQVTSNAIGCPDVCTCRNYLHEGLTVNCSLLLKHNGNNSRTFTRLKQLVDKIPNNTRNIHISHSQLSRLPVDSLNNLHQLRELYLTYNSLSNYSSWNRALSSQLAAELSHLSLANNNLQNIKPRSFKNFVKLHSIDLSANKIELIYPKSFQGLESLLILDLRNNSLKSLTKTCFEHLKTIQQLFLEFNQIVSIDDGTFEELSDLQTLYLIGNRLKVITSGMFMGANKLQHLYLSENLIERIEASAVNRMTKLQELWLNGNRLTTLDSRLEKSFQRLRYGQLNLDHNPFSCDCSLVWLANWLRQHTNENITNTNNNVNNTNGFIVPYPQCSSPSTHNATFIHTIPLQDFHCGNSSYQPHRCGSDFLNLTTKSNSRLTKIDDDCYNLRTRVCDYMDHKNGQDFQYTVEDSCLCNLSVSDCYGNALFLCPEGWYGNYSTRAEEIKCQQCQVLTGSSFGSRRKADCKCLPGFYSDSSNQLTMSSCMGCPINFYKSILGSQQCTQCSQGAITKSSGATICECLPGFQLHLLNDSASICEPCPNDTYKKHSGPHRCLQCPNYSTSPAGSTSIKQCNCSYGTKEPGSLLLSPHRNCRPPSEGFVDTSHAAKVQDYRTNNMEILSIILLSIALLTVIALIAVVAVQRILRQKNKEQERISEAKKAQIVQICIPQPVEDAWIQTNLSSWEIPRKNLKLCQVLGQGAFGQVYEALLDKDGVSTKVAVKCCRESSSAVEEQETLWSELKLLIYVGKHPNIVNLIGTSFQQNSLMLILEYAAVGDLLTLLRTKAGIRRLEPTNSVANTTVTAPVSTTVSTSSSPGSNLKRLSQRLNPLRTDMIPNILYNYHSPSDTASNQLTLVDPNSPTATTVSNDTMETMVSSIDESTKIIDERLLLSLAWQITKGMEHLEQLKCIHRDLAARNILISEDFVAKISDFGLAREAYESGYYFRQSKGRLPFKWMAPEALLQGQCTNKSDVWSFGIVLWEMMTLGATPYPGVPLNSLMDLLLSGYRMPKPDACRDDIFDVMQACWRETPSERPTFHDLCYQTDCIMQTASNQHYISIESGIGEDFV